MPLASQFQEQFRRELLGGIYRALANDDWVPSAYLHDHRIAAFRDDGFRWWLAVSGCFELVNRLLYHDQALSSLHNKGVLLASKVARDVVELIHGRLGISAVTFKHLDIFAEGPVVGRVMDVDVLLEDRVAARQAGELLAASGWVQGSYRKSTGFAPAASCEIEAVEAVHYQTLPFWRILKVQAGAAEMDRLRRLENCSIFETVGASSDAVEVVFRVDLHWNVMLNLDVSKLERVASLLHSGFTFDPADHSYILIQRLFAGLQNNECKPKDVAGIIYLLRSQRFSEDRFSRVIHTLGNEHAVNAVLSLLAQDINIVRLRSSEFWQRETINAEPLWRELVSYKSGLHLV